MIKAAVIGHPVKHSKSPMIHTHWMRGHKIKGQYQAIDIAPNDLAHAVRDLVRDGYAGFNVTVPHKIAMMDLCDDIDETARAIGAVNTVVVRDGLLYGRNTDAFGFIANIKAALPDYSFNAPAMVLGAGGAARAVAYGLLKEGVPHIAVCNRSQVKAEALCAMDPQRMIPVEWGERDLLSDYPLLVNTTSLGMDGQPPLDIELGRLPPQSVVCDIVYAPLMTGLLDTAQAQGHHIVTGIGMLLHQARPAFEAWTGVMPDVDAALMQKVLA